MNRRQSCIPTGPRTSSGSDNNGRLSMKMPRRRPRFASERCCETCGSSYVPLSQNQQYCTKKCRPNNSTYVWLVERLCETCQQPYTPRAKHQRYCGSDCWPYRVQPAPWAIPLPTGTVGALAELRIATDLMCRGYNVFRALSPSCYCDLLASKNEHILHVEARTGSFRNGIFYFPPAYRPGVTCLAIWDKYTDKIYYLVPGTRTLMDV